MTKNSNEVLDELFGAIDKIVDVRIQDLNFNKTLLCEIVDDSQKQRYKYTVTDGVTRFDAFSSENAEYKKGDRVYIIIPNNDFDQQKTIIGRYKKDDDTSIKYISPLNSFLKQESIPIEKSDLEIKGLVANYSKILKIWEYTRPNDYIKGYDKLGFSGSFKTNFKYYDIPKDDNYIVEDNSYIMPTEGNYGMFLVLYDEDGSTFTDLEDGTSKRHILYLKSETMYGDIYNFSLPTQQEACFDISNIKQIKKIEAYIYEEGNFYNPEFSSELLNYHLKGYQEDKPNINISDLQIYFGTSIDRLKEGSIIISSERNKAYQGDVEGVSLNATLFLSKEEIIQTDEELHKLDNVEISWYKYDSSLENKWGNPINSQQSLRLDNINLSHTNKSEQFKVVIETPSKKYLDNSKEILNELNNYNKEIKNEKSSQIIIQKTESLLKKIKDSYNTELFDSNLTQDNDAIKELYSIDEDDNIIIKGKDEDLEQLFELWEAKILDKISEYSSAAEKEIKTYSSNIFTFTNLDKTSDATTQNEYAKIMVDIDEYNGIYFLYDNKNKIGTPAESQKKRLLEAELSNDLDDIDDVYWYIPIQNTMIDYVFSKNGEKVNLIGVDNNLHIFEPAADTELGTHYKIKGLRAFYQIKDNYNMNYVNNSIYFQIENEGEIIELSHQLSFGPKGSQGVEYTFLLEPSERRPLKIAGDEIILRPKLLDSLGKEIELIENINYSFYPNIELNDNDFIEVIPYATECILKIKEGASIEDLRYKILQAIYSITINNQTLNLVAYYSLDFTILSGEVLYYGTNTIMYDNKGGSPEYYKDTHYLEIDGQVNKDLIWSISLDKNEDINFYPKFNQNMLLVSNMYISELNTNIAIEATNEDNEVIFSHPLRIYQDVYNSKILNSWDGNLTIDEKNGTILSSIIGAGKKDKDEENNNVFTGILMGQIDKNQNGLFGYHQGAQSFGFNSDGTAFLGKSGKGRIIFNGNSGLIESANFSKKDIFENEIGTGMQIDLESGKIVSKSELIEQNNKFYQSTILLNPLPEENDDDAYFLIKDIYNKSILYINKNDYYLKSSNFPGAKLGFEMIPNENLYEDIINLGEDIPLRINRKDTENEICYLIISDSQESNVHEKIIYFNNKEENKISIFFNNDSTEQTLQEELNFYNDKNKLGKITVSYENNNTLRIVAIDVSYEGYTKVYTTEEGDLNSSKGMKIDLANGSIYAYDLTIKSFKMKDDKQLSFSIDTNSEQVITIGDNFNIDWEGNLSISNLETDSIFSRFIKGDELDLNYGDIDSLNTGDIRGRFLSIDQIESDLIYANRLEIGEISTDSLSTNSIGTNSLTVLQDGIFIGGYFFHPVELILNQGGSDSSMQRTQLVLAATAF